MFMDLPLATKVANIHSYINSRHTKGTDMTNLSTKLLRNLAAVEPKVTIEKASADHINGYAKVLFSTNLTRQRAREVVSDPVVLEKAFMNVLGDKAHLVTATVHPAGDNEGNYFAFVKINSPRVALEDAAKEGSGYHLVAANVFADDDDQIWDVQEDASGNKIIVRNSVEDLTDLLSSVTVSPVNMSVAAAGISLDAKTDFASLVSFLDPETEKFHNGITLDTAHVYDFEAKKIKKISAAMAVAGTDAVLQIRAELNNRMGSTTATVPELAAANVQDVIDYLDTLYQNNPIFLANYKAAVLRYIKV